MERLGINSQQLKTLLVVYLKQDFRSGKSFLQSGAKEYATSNLALLSMLGIYIFVGFSTAIFAFTGMDIFRYSIVASSVTLFIVALAVIAESGNVIFNETEPDILGHLPVNSRTLFAAKVLSIFLFTVLLAIAANILPTIAGVFVKGSNVLFILAHTLSAILSALFATMLVLTSYGLLMRYIDKERFNNFIAYAQTGFSVFLILGYQLLPRLANQYQLETSLESRKYFLLYPPAWFSGVTLVMMGKFDWLTLALASLALISLAIVGFIALQKVAAGYSSFAAQLAYDSNTRIGKSKNDRDLVAAKANGQNIARRLPVAKFLKAFFLPSPVERAVFDLVATYLRRDREIKVRLYPSFSYLIMFPLIFIITGDLPDPFIEQDFVISAIFGTAMLPVVTSIAAEAILFSEHYQAAYIFRAAPIANLSDIHRGLRKATQMYVALPGAVLLLVLYTFLWRNLFHAFLVIIPWLILTPALMMFSFIGREFLPLSRRYQKGQQSARTMIIFFASFFCLAIGGTAQSLSIQGSLPYWLFLTATLAVSSLLYFVLHRVCGEIRPLLPATSIDE